VTNLLHLPSPLLTVDFRIFGAALSTQPQLVKSFSDGLYLPESPSYTANFWG
jgi:hypothetical protein